MRNRIIDIEDRSEDLHDLLRQDPAFRADFLRKLELTFLHHENALDGVVYGIAEIDAALRGVTVAEASIMNGYRDVQNHRAAVDRIRTAVEDDEPRPTLGLVKELHGILTRGNEAKLQPEFRREIPLHRTYFHEIAQPPKIAALLAKLFELTASSDFQSMHGIQRSARFQLEFMRIFPYTEDSGRIARLVGNMFLLDEGLDPVVIPAVDRQRYYESFKLGEGQLRELLLESLENQLASAEKFVREALRQRRRAAR